ncbi:MAG: class I mannose-6-phosphate isomerase [Verrucomicrobiales bacterium]|nr:class I mannose-6-phosphate isomerase [Verrucomicrobiales bacterium]
MSTFLESFLHFIPIYQTRVWGGRTLESRIRRELPDQESPYGESWEISAREEADCAVKSGGLAGKKLTELWGDPELRSAIFGPGAPVGDRFPLLCKILDARAKLSVQVHPPESVAAELGGEPKTEVWYIAAADPGAEIYVGVKEGVTEATFREGLEEGSVESLLHSIPVKEGEHIFIPSGRLHAIGAGLVIYEIQQNSDTTFRVFDWNRLGLNGKPRDLHVEESLHCIDFSDVEPGMDQAKEKLLCECEHFRMERHILSEGGSVGELTAGRFSILTVIRGKLSVGYTAWTEGDFLMIPHGAEEGLPQAGESGCEFLLTTW